MREPELITVWSLCHSKPDQATREQVATFVWMNASLFSRHDEIYSQYLSGLVSEAFWNKHRDASAAMLANPILRNWWDGETTIFTEGLREAVNSVDVAPRRWA
jgi:hypothetical protein